MKFDLLNKPCPSLKFFELFFETVGFAYLSCDSAIKIRQIKNLCYSTVTDKLNLLWHKTCKRHSILTQNEKKINKNMTFIDCLFNKMILHFSMSACNP